MEYRIPDFFILIVLIVGLVGLLAIGLGFRWLVRRQGWGVAMLVGLLGGAAVIVPILVGGLFWGFRSHAVEQARDQLRARHEAAQQAAVKQRELMRRQRIALRARERSPKVVQPAVSDPPVVAPRPQGNQQTLPKWVTTEHPHSLRVISGEQYPNPEVARSYALLKASAVVGKAFQQQYPVAAGWSPHAANVKRIAVSKLHVEPIVRSAGEHDFTVHRAYLLVDLSPETLDQFKTIWKAQTKKAHRAWFAILLAVVVGAVGLLAGFFRIDEWSKGRYRWPLIGATFVGIGLLAAVPFFTSHFVASYQHAAAVPRTTQLAVPTAREAPRPGDVEDDDGIESRVECRWHGMMSLLEEDAWEGGEDDE